MSWWLWVLLILGGLVALYLVVQLLMVVVFGALWIKAVKKLK